MSRRGASSLVAAAVMLSDILPTGFEIGVRNGRVKPGELRRRRRRRPRLVAQGRLDPDKFVSHRFTLDSILDAYDTFGRAAQTQALKVIISD